MIVELFGALTTLLYTLLIQFHADTALSQDLGRHLKLGELIVKSGAVPMTNLFTYTYGSYQFVNHHWLSEVLLYVLYTATGFTGLMVLKLAIFIAIGITAWICFRSDKTRRWMFYITQIILVPLFFDRPDLRPEIFGYLFFAYFLFVLYKKRSIRWLLPVPFVMLLWVNMHITFVFGYLLLGLIILKYKRPSVPFILASGAAVLMNPRGLYGAVFPFLIFKDYGYAIAENQSLLFLLQNTSNIHLKYFAVLIPFFIIVLPVLLWKKKFALATLFGVFLALSCVQVRHLPFFTVTAFVCVPEALSTIVSELSRRHIKIPAFINFPTILTAMLGIYLYVLLSFYVNMSTQNRFLQLKFEDDYINISEFVLKNHLPARIFNNFDIGGYLDYRLYPTYKTFVDNRPDAFPGTFFSETYIPMQENPDVFNKVVEQYGIRTIVFSHTDQTPWAQTFIRNVLGDNSWKLVYLDGVSLAMTRDKRFVSIGSNKTTLRAIMDSETDARKLLYLSRIFSYLKQNDLMIESLNKAHTKDPDSCAVNITLSNMYANSASEYYRTLGLTLRNDYWYCF